MPETKPNWLRNHSTGQAVTQVTPTYIAYPSLCAATEQCVSYTYCGAEQYSATLNSWHLTFLSSPTSPLIFANSPNPRAANRATHVNLYFQFS